MRILITGSSGMLGSALCPLLSERNDTILATDINANGGAVCLDIADMEGVKKVFADFGPEAVFHLAAVTDVDGCEIQQEEAYRTNTLGTENIVFSCMKRDIPLVYISTAAVFDGKKKVPYTEFDLPNPLNVYAKTKLEGESIVARSLKRYFIVRAGWMIGGIDKDKKFVSKIIKQLDGQKEIFAVADKVGSLTFTKDIAKGLLSLVETERYGLYHMANKGSCSRYDIAKLIVKFMGRDDIAVTPATSEMFPLPALRPDLEAIDNFKLTLMGMNNMPTWEEALEEYVFMVKKSREPVGL
ncbi:MAG: dTDP-4-dehydrorhamnose reductase [Candidatus Omnitrophica bacterium]|nr:dTDP-4-dehydrorhamnose reductase [Candidatus Omnitrophota bacterium]